MHFLSPTIYTNAEENYTGGGLKLKIRNLACKASRPEVFQPHSTLTERHIMKTLYNNMIEK
jgi:hypothetical protein